MEYSPIISMDVLIIGAGPVGLACAIWMAKRNYNVVVIEQYSETKQPNKVHFSSRTQQLGLNAESLNFLKEMDVFVWGEITRMGCKDVEGWYNIPIYVLQNILYKQAKNHTNVKFLFDTKLESVSTIGTQMNARVILVRTPVIGTEQVYGVSPRLIIICDGKHDEKGTATKYFNFSCSCKVHLSTYGIVGMIDRKSSDTSSICLNNFSRDNYYSELHPELGSMYIRLLGNMSDRYIALGLGDVAETNHFLALSTNQIKNLLIEAYNKNRDVSMNEPALTDDNNFSSFSKTPIPIILDYRKETIRIHEGSSTIVTSEGDSARRTTFFSGSGLNSGYKALRKLFKLCSENEALLFKPSFTAKDLLILDQKLLEKDTECLQISYELLKKGVHYLGSSIKTCNEKDCEHNEPLITSISPNTGEALSFIRITGENFIKLGKSPVCIFEWEGGMKKTDKVHVYDKDNIGVYIPLKAQKEIKITVERADGESAISPVSFTVIQVVDPPIITNIYKENEWICIEGKNFKMPSTVTVNDGKTMQSIPGYCQSSDFILLSTLVHLNPPLTFNVSTVNGQSQPFTMS